MSLGDGKEVRGDIPAPLEPLYRIADLISDVQLSKCRMHISFPNEEIWINGEIYLIVNPRLNIEFRSGEKAKSFSLFAALVNGQVEAVIENYPQTHWDLIDLDPVRARADPCHVSMPKDVLVQSVKFHLVNFQNFVGSGIGMDGSVVSLRKGRVIFRANNWRVTIDNLPGTGNAIEKWRNRRDMRSPMSENWKRKMISDLRQARAARY